jgi:hypothetical protein
LSEEVATKIVELARTREGDLFDARDNFARADQNVTELKRRISRQRSVIEQAKQRGRPVAAAELVLRALESSLRAFEKHRQVIFARQEAKERPAIDRTETQLLPAAPVAKREAEEDGGP